MLINQADGVKQGDYDTFHLVFRCAWKEGATFFVGQRQQFALKRLTLAVFQKHGRRAALEHCDIRQQDRFISQLFVGDRITNFRPGRNAL